MATMCGMQNRPASNEFDPTVWRNASQSENAESVA